MPEYTSCAVIVIVIIIIVMIMEKHQVTIQGKNYIYNHVLNSSLN